MPAGLPPTGKSVAAPKDPVPVAPVPVLRSTETLSESWLATARSFLPSPLKSAVVVAMGHAPAGKGLSGAGANVTDEAAQATPLDRISADPRALSSSSARLRLIRFASPSL